MEIVYNKLVRDKIPEIIKENGKTCKFKIVNENEYKKELIRKLYEEIAEFEEAWNVEELADIFEVMYSIIDIGEFDIDQIMKIRLKKREKRGGFEKRIFLESVSENKK